MWIDTYGNITLAELVATEGNYANRVCIYMNGELIDSGYKDCVCEQYGKCQVLSWAYSSGMFFAAIL